MGGIAAISPHTAPFFHVVDCVPIRDWANFKLVDDAMRGGALNRAAFITVWRVIVPVAVRQLQSMPGPAELPQKEVINMTILTVRQPDGTWLSYVPRSDGRGYHQPVELRFFWSQQ
jgi:hypothetical protein